MIRFHTVLLLLVLTVILFYNCSAEDPCKVDHIIINGECMPTYIFPNTSGAIEEGRYYHHYYYGVISFQEGLWYDSNRKPIAQLNVECNY